MANRVRSMTDDGPACPSCASMRDLVEKLVAAGIDWLDACDAPAADLEDDETEIESEDDGIVDQTMLARAIR